MKITSGNGDRQKIFNIKDGDRFTIVNDKSGSGYWKNNTNIEFFISDGRYGWIGLENGHKEYMWSYGFNSILEPMISTKSIEEWL